MVYSAECRSLLAAAARVEIKFFCEPFYARIKRGSTFWVVSTRTYVVARQKILSKKNAAAAAIAYAALDPSSEKEESKR